MRKPTRREFGWMLIGAALFVALMIVFAMSGCGLKEQHSTLDQKQRESIAETTTAKVLRETATVQPEVNVKTTAKDGSSTEVTIPATATQKIEAETAATADSDSAASGNAAQSDSFPMFVKLIGVGVGLLILLLVWWLIRRSSKAVDAAWVAADGMVASKIHNLRTHQTASTDPNVIAALKTQEAELQRLRAEMLAP